MKSQGCIEELGSGPSSDHRGHGVTRLMPFPGGNCQALGAPGEAISQLDFIVIPSPGVERLNLVIPTSSRF